MSGATVRTLAHRVEPAAHGDRTTLLLLHGTGGGEGDLLELGAQLAPGAARLSPRGAVDEGGQNRFFRRHAEGVFDTDDLTARADELAAWTRAACATYDRPADGVIAVGFSNGANIAWAAAVRDPALLRGAVLLAPMLPFDPAETPLLADRAAPPDLSGLAVLIGAGRADPIAPPAQAEALAGWLTDCGAAVELRWHDGGHQPGSGVLADARDWVAKLRAAITADGGALP